MTDHAKAIHCKLVFTLEITLRCANEGSKTN